LKTDNHNVEAKLGLRKEFIANGMSVLDCFSGEGEAIWSTLRKQYQITEYVALDIKAKKNRLKIDSLRFLQSQDWIFDVVDLDAYGSPWSHWMEVLKTNRQSEIIVFLTIGSAVFGRLSSVALRSMNLPKETPSGMHKQLSSESVSFMLAECYKFDWIVIKASEAMNHGGSARYLALHLKKQHNGKHDHRLDQPHLQRMDGMHKS
jgi:hypothetical protein